MVAFAKNPFLDTTRLFFRESYSPRLRGMRAFAEQEIVIPGGPHAGKRFRCERQPFTAHWFAAVESRLWRRHAATGPVQSGKSLACFVIPIMYHLFEMREPVICLVPDMDMAADKWREDILPAVARSRFRDLLPVRGGGSRGGKFDSITFANGATLKFMSAGGGDKSRAGYTARVVAITEADGMDEASQTSREADPVTQAEARTAAYGSRAVIYIECSVSIQQGRIWQEYLHGTESRLACRCPHCRGYVSPEREHLTGWKDAESLVDARQQAAFACPACGQTWSEHDRRQANLDAKLLHRGQQLGDDDEIQGQPPATNTLGFRWSAVNNLFVTAADIGELEWKAQQAADTRSADKSLRQFVWTLPHEPAAVDVTPLAIEAIAARTGDTARGVIPAACQHVSLGIDLRKRELHYALLAWHGLARGRVADYGVLGVNGDRLGAELGVLTALRDFRDQIEAGWQQAGAPRVPDQVWIDAGWLTDVVFQFVNESNALCQRTRYRAIVGRGVGVYNSHKYAKPKAVTDAVRFIGEEYHFTWQEDRRNFLIEINTDYWKTWVHERLSAPADGDGALTLFDAPPREHLLFARHLTSERKVVEFEPGKGEQVRWVKERHENHWLDTTYIACAAGHKCGVRLTTPPATPPARPQTTRDARPPNPFSPDGRPYLATER